MPVNNKSPLEFFRHRSGRVLYLGNSDGYLYVLETS